MSEVFNHLFTQNVLSSILSNTIYPRWGSFHPPPPGPTFGISPKVGKNSSPALPLAPLPEACSPEFCDGTVFRAPRLPSLLCSPFPITPGHAKQITYYRPGPLTSVTLHGTDYPLKWGRCRVIDVVFLSLLRYVPKVSKPVPGQACPCAKQSHMTASIQETRSAWSLCHCAISLHAAGNGCEVNRGNALFWLLFLAEEK